MLTTIRNLLVPFDGSPPARAALDLAVLLASRSGATLTLAYVLPGGSVLAGVGATGAARDARALLDEAAAQLPGTPKVVLLEGDPAQALTAEADRMDADLLVLGSRGRSPLAGLVLGSTVRALLNSCRRPVLVAHQRTGAVSRVIACVDGGESAERVATAAATLAGATGAAVTLVNAVDADKELVQSPERFGIPGEVWKEALARHSERVFAPLRALAPGADEVTRYGRANVELRDAAHELGAQVLVVARRGRSGLDVDAWFSVAFALAVRGPFATLVV